MYKIMKALITKHYYKALSDVKDKLDVFFAFDRLSKSEYEELSALATEIYGALEE